MKRNIVLISKSGSVKTQSAKNLVLNELYKKCKLKNSNDFEKRHTWKTHDDYVTIYAKNNGRAGQENKYDSPSPIDTDLYFNSMVVIYSDYKCCSCYDYNNAPCYKYRFSWETATCSFI